MLLVSACNKSEIANDENAEKKGFALPVTVNVTREGDDTKATYNESTRKLEFSAGDKLFVQGSDYPLNSVGQFAGKLTWVSDGTFSGTITTQHEWTKTAAELFEHAISSGGSVSATLLPAGYESYDYLEIMDEGYEALLGESANNSFATSKKLAVEQLSYETGSYTSGTGFVLEPQNAILNFTITGLTASTEVTATLTDGSPLFNIEGDVTTDGSGNATFAMGVSGNTDLNDFTLSVAGNPVTLVSSSKVLEAGKIYNITRVANAINGKFSVSATKQVYFSKGNLRCVSLDSGTSWSWSFFEHQYDRYSSFNAYSWDKFGWVGESGTLTSGIEQWGASISETDAGYGASATEKLKSDWGNVPGIGSGWRTLSGGDSGEWNYLFNGRSASTVGGTSNGRYAKGTVNGVHGVILFPDTYTHPGDVTAPTNVNTTNASFDSNTYDVTAWAKMEAAGCVFLPITGTRTGKTISNVDRGYYWSSTAYHSDERFAYGVHFYSDNLRAGNMTAGRYCGRSVRLVRDAD
ncbi:MAG: DUF1566 domain-containing protein [Bacteroidota bacterium]|nr:DUF1566 domain-containing protein [Bacteroidota bacterium]